MPPDSQTAITLRGPFWEADAFVLEGSFGQGQQATIATHFRSLFVEVNPRAAAGQQFHLPGTMLALVRVQRVRITPPASRVTWTRQQGPSPTLNTEAQIREAISNGSAALLLLQARPNDGADGKHEFTCIGGEIWLDRPQALNDFWAKCDVEAVDQCRVHGSGVSVHGTVAVPWEGDRLVAWLMLTIDLPHAADRNQDKFRLTFEHERMTVEEVTALRQAWQNLSRIINPRHPRNDYPDLVDFPPTPTWVTFEISDPLAAPHFYWSLSNWTAELTRVLHFQTDEVAVLLTDQRPYPGPADPDLTALAQIVPQNVVINRTGDELEITLSAGNTSVTAETLAYAWEREGQIDSIKAEQLLVAFDPVQTADFLRRAQSLPTPVLSRDEEGNVLGHPYKSGQEAQYENYDGPLLDPSLLWGFMPLEDGWAQLPFANVTEQVYIDLGLAKPLPAPDERPPFILSGALYLGNDAPAVLAGYCDEQPWNMALVNALGASATWVIKANGDGYELDKVTLTLSRPDLFLNGLLWLSTGAPTVEDALPDLNRWTSAVRRMPLRTLDQVDDVFPPLLRLRLSNFAFQLRPTIRGLCSDGTAPEVTQASAELNALTIQFEVDDELFQKLTADKNEEDKPIPPALPPDAFSVHLPLIWRRHPRLPMVQALPLTQNRHAPNYPNASRQLVPYVLGTSEEHRPTAEWRFALDGANAWPRLDGQAIVAPEWGELFDLPLVALSLPGLELDPNPGLPELGLLPATDDELQLPAQLRFDLPYLDQINALAQLPKPVRSPAETSPLPDAPPPEPPLPLRRETYAAFWRGLAEKASLASADAVDAVLRQSDATFVKHLIEPLRWPVTVDLRLDAYPGAMSLANATGDSAALELAQEAALRGFDGHFAAEDDGTLRRLPAPDGGYQVTAGTMAAHPEAHNAYRDQRGLLRRASATAGTALIKTPVLFNQAVQTDQAYELTSVRQPLTLTVNGAEWTKFWFRDLPVDVTTQRFTWASTRSTEATTKHTDINDPDAQARDYNFLTGYQWHLGGGLVLGGLHFHPLILERVALQDNEVRRAVVIGRLQLPITGYDELTDLSNAVRLTFDRQADGTLGLTAAQLLDAADGQGEWPLALKGGEITAAPLLTWTAVALSTEGDALTVSGVVLRFYLFDVPWAVALDPLTFPLGTMEPISITRTFTVNAAAALQPTSLVLTLNLSAAQIPPGEDETVSPHQCELTLRVQLGERRLNAEDAAPSKRRAAFDTFIIFPLIGGSGPRWDAPVLFNDLLIESETQPAQLLYKQHTLQFNWTRFTPRTGLDAGLELLPGMPLAVIVDGEGQARYTSAPGFAVLRFTLTSNGEVPEFEPQTGFVEVLLTCKWGTYLADLAPGSSLALDPTPAQVFGSSAGDIVFAYTSSLAHEGDGPMRWDETFMLNGFVEIKNLISWPQGLHYNGEQALLELPQAQAGSLGHRRHSIRILFNQHEILPALPVIGDGHLLFHFAGRPWQFLAVVEHQIAHLGANDGRITLTGEQCWTAIQEVRLCTAAGFKSWLELQRAFPSPLHGQAQSLAVTVKDDINQLVRYRQNGEIEIIISHDPSEDIQDPVPRGTHWIGNINPLASGPGSYSGSYTGFLFELKGIPQGARINSARFSVLPVPASVPGTRSDLLCLLKTP